MDIETEASTLNIPKENTNFHSTIDVNISKLILTPLTCATLVNEIIKSLIFQKSQIPYPYNRLKNVVMKKRNQTENDSNYLIRNFTISNHFRTVSSAYDNLENIMTNLIKEFTNNSNIVKEVVVVFGVTPNCPKEVFTIKISALARGHVEANHLLESNTNRGKILRNIFLSQNWVDSIDASLQCMNTYIYLKKGVDNKTETSDSDFFIPSKPFEFPPKVKHITINLLYDNSDILNSCCDNLQIFQDIGSNLTPQKKIENSHSDNLKTDYDEFWYYSKTLIKGFKDCFVNKVSASELW